MFVTYILQAYFQPVTKVLVEFWDIIGPGGQLHPAYFLEHKGHLVIEAALLLLIVYLFFQHSFKPRQRAEDPLTEKEVDTLCRDWEPEPLAPNVAEEDQLPEPPVFTSADGKYMLIDGKPLLNVGSSDFFGLTRSTALLDVARETIDKYGVGACGPRGFYGTIDVHLKLEDRLAKFFGTASGIIYSYDIATVTSVIAAYANRNDVVIADERCNYAVQAGLVACRARTIFFKHNDMADLQRCLQKVIDEDKKLRKPLNRRFIVVEGMYSCSGALAPLDEIYILKDKFKFNLIVDESNSVGVLGKLGRGAAEHWGIPPEGVEILVGSMGGALASSGGFCVGDYLTIDHQRLSSSAYIYSAALPPFLATAALAALDYLDSRGAEGRTRLDKVSRGLRSGMSRIRGLRVVAAYEASPIIHVSLATPPKSRKEETMALYSIVGHMAKQGGVLAPVCRYSNLDRLSTLLPTIKVYASAAFTDEDVQCILAALENAAKAVLQAV